MSDYDPGLAWRQAQPRVVEGFLRACVDLAASDRLRLALFEAGIVESNLRDLPGGDRDSVGPLQQRPGGDWPRGVAPRRDPYLAALAFLRVARRMVSSQPAGATAGQIAQAVQRSAYPKRYDEAERAARYVIEQATKDGTPMASWHLAPSLDKLFEEVNARWPRRSKASDGTIGDAAHSSRVSQHNPDKNGIVRAADITVKGIAKQEVLDALIGDSRVWYVIHDRKIYSRTHDWKPQRYTGTNPHTAHIHVSLILDSATAANSRKSWGIFPAGAKAEPKPIEPGSRTVSEGSEGSDVKVLQKAVGTKADGIYGPLTTRAVKIYQKAHGLAPDGIVGRHTWRKILAELETTS